MKTVANVFGGLGKVPVIGQEALNQIERALMAAIHDVVPKRAVAAGHIDGFQDAELGRVLHPTIRIARRPIDVNYHRVVRIVRINLSRQFAVDPLVGTHIAEFSATEGEFCAIDNDAGNSRCRRARTGRQCGFRACDRRGSATIGRRDVGGRLRLLAAGDEHRREKQTEYRRASRRQVPI